MAATLRIMLASRHNPALAHAALILALTAGSAPWLAACECGDPTVTVRLTDPSDGATLTASDDTAADRPGVQITVRADTDGLAVGEIVELLIDGATDDTATVDEDGTIAWTDVTIPPGEHTLMAVTLDGVTSDEVTVRIDDTCFAVAFVTPEPIGDALILGPDDDLDGEACGATFETDVAISTGAPDGSTARIYVNGTPRRTARVSGGAARFDGVVLDNRGDTPNRLRVEVENREGLACPATLEREVFVACAGVSCAITAPDAERPFLRQEDDVSDREGMQVDVEVTTDEAGAGHDVALILDGRDAGTVTPPDRVATFPEVELAEGTHRFVAECRDASGSVTRSGPVEWTVDFTPCGVEIVEPFDGTTISGAEDLNPSTPATEIGVTAVVDADCREIRLDHCDAIEAAPFERASSTFATTWTLSAERRQSLCAETRDAAGNVGRHAVSFSYRPQTPQVAIATPAPGTGFNVAGTGGRVADLLASTDDCEARFEVYCTGVGERVYLHRDDTEESLGVADCVADVTAPTPYRGRATFPMVALPTDEAAYAVSARQSLGSVVGRSTPIAIRADCAAPVLTLTRPACGTVLSAATQDEDASAAGFQDRTVVESPTEPDASVTLTIAPAGGAPIDAITRDAVVGTATFDDARYDAGGALEVAASARDDAGNVGVSAACSVTIDDLPSVVITSPVGGAVIAAADDCDARAGMDVRVVGTTDAAAGSDVAVTIGTETVTAAVGSGGAIDVCAAAPEGRAVPIRVAVTDARGTGAAAFAVVVDAAPPDTAIEPLTPTVEHRRAGRVRLSWTAVADAGGHALDAYDLRCADAPIASDADWDAASPVPLAIVPAAPGTAEAAIVDGFRSGVPRHCVLRAADPTGALTPRPASSAEVLLPFEETAVAPFGGTAAFGRAVAAVGDVDGDALDDVLVGGEGYAYLYGGAPPAFGPLPDAPRVVFTSADASFGEVVAGIGDLDGDRLPDFAVAAPDADGGAGRVYVFFGRFRPGDWPGSCDVDAGCADLVISSDAGAAGALGASLAAAGDFDGDGFDDLAIGAPGLGRGAVYVVLGDPGGIFPGTLPEAAGSGPRGFIVLSPTGTSGFGAAIAAIGGDVTGDGRADLLVASPGDAGASEPARLTLVAGQEVGSSFELVAYDPTLLVTIDTGAAGSFGVPLAAAGDVHGDGALDLLAYAGAPDDGAALLYEGAGGGAFGAPVTIANDAADATGDRFAAWLATARHAHPELGNVGDLDRDGRAEILLGSAEHGSGDGAAHLFYGRASWPGPARSLADVTFDAAPGDGARVVAFGGDVDGDGFGDIVIGEPDADGGAGRLVILH